MANTNDPFPNINFQQNPGIMNAYAQSTQAQQTQQQIDERRAKEFSEMEARAVQQKKMLSEIKAKLRAQDNE